MPFPAGQHAECAEEREPAIDRGRRIVVLAINQSRKRT